jgi:hypothetical protein
MFDINMNIIEVMSVDVEKRADVEADVEVII